MLAALAGRAGVAGGLGVRRPLTGSPHPSVAQTPSQVIRPGSLRASVTWPLAQVPRHRTRPFGLVTWVTMLRGPGVTEVTQVLTVVNSQG